MNHKCLRPRDAKSAYAPLSEAGLKSPLMSGFHGEACDYAANT